MLLLCHHQQDLLCTRVASLNLTNRKYYNVAYYTYCWPLFLVTTPAWGVFGTTSSTCTTTCHFISCRDTSTPQTIVCATTITHHQPFLLGSVRHIITHYSKIGIPDFRLPCKATKCRVGCLYSVSQEIRSTNTKVSRSEHVETNFWTDYVHHYILKCQPFSNEQGTGTTSNPNPPPN